MNKKQQVSPKAIVKKARKRYHEEHKIHFVKLRKKRNFLIRTNIEWPRTVLNHQPKLSCPPTTPPEVLKEFINSLSPETKKELGEKIKNFTSALPPNKKLKISLIPLNLVVCDGVTRQRYRLHLSTI
jgi:hypothetical protein